MPEQVRRVYDPIRARWDILTPPQRYKLLGVIAVVLVALALTLFLAFRTNWETIVNGESRMALAPMMTALDNAGIRNRTTNHGAGLQVDARRSEEAMTLILLEGATPNHDHFTWERALDTGIGTTDDERRLLAVRGAEGAIASQLVAMNGINTAQVSLAVPSSRPFDNNAPQPSAAVQLNVSQDFSPNQGRNLARLVAMNVARLEPDSVIIMDQHARTIFNGAEDINDDVAGTAQQVRDQYRNQKVMSLRQLFLNSFDEADVAFNPVFDDTLMSERISTVFEIPEGMDSGGIPHHDIWTRAGMEGVGGGLEPGLANNTASFPNYLNIGNERTRAYQRTGETFYNMNTITEATTTGQGWVDPERSTASIVAVRERHVNQEHWMADVAEGEAPRTQMDWEIFRNESTSPTLINGTFEEFERFHSLAASALGIPAENITLLIQEQIVPHDTVVTPWDIPTILMVAVLLLLLAMLLYGLLRRQRLAGEDEEALEPQLAVEDLLVSTQLEEAREEAAQELEEIDMKENEIKRHIEKFVNEKPEAVAALLRNWINVEEW